MKKHKIKARQIITSASFTENNSTGEIFVLPTGELRDMGDTLPEKRIKWLAIIGVILLGIIAVRSFHLEASQNLFRKQVEGNRMRLRVEYAPRGVMFDRNGKQLVQNVASTDLVVYPAQLPADIESEIGVLRSIFPNVKASEFQEVLNAADRTSAKPVPLLPNINHEQMVAVLARSQELPGVRVENLPTREYEGNGIFSHILGYMGRINADDHKKNPDYLLTESIGKSGLEKTYESVLRGVHGAKKEEVDVRGRMINDLGTVPAKPGVNLRLNIDADLQKRLHDDLKAQLKNAGESRGAAVAIDPRDGGILALVSIPEFDNTKLTQGMSSSEITDLFSNKDEPLLNRVIQGEYAPGSTFKLVLAIAGLEDGVINRGTTIDSTGGISVGSWFFPDWKAGGHGTTDIIKAIAESVNTYFYMVGGGVEGRQGLGIEKITAWAKKLGFGEPLGIDIPGETDGFLPSQEWKKRVKKEPWYIGDTYHASIGQGDVLVTPLQICSLTATIANGGTLYEPRLAQALLRNDGSEMEVIHSKARGQLFSKQTAEILQTGMRETVLSGSGRALSDLPVAVAGKTGTAQVIGKDKDKTHAWFTSYAPYENPQIALTVMLEKSGGGDKFAVPIAKDIYKWYFGGKKDEEIDFLKKEKDETKKNPID